MANPASADSTSEKTSIVQNIAAAATYLLFFVTGIVFLVMEKEDEFVRFHAMQSTLTFGGLFILVVVLTQTRVVGWVVDSLLVPLTLIVWIVLVFKAISGERFKLPFVGTLAERQLGRLT